MKELLYELITTLASVLGHSLWVGMLASFLYYVIVRSRSTISPSCRVVLGEVLLCGIPIFSILFGLGILKFALLSLSVVITIPVLWPILLVLVWEIGLFFATARLAFAWRITKRLRGEAQMVSPGKPQIAVSSNGIGPALVGICHPKILIPHNQTAEPILLHEKAHFLRGDHWRNGLQVLLEALLFYHPAARWLSREIRMEREKSCDDLAVSMMNGNRMHYAAALLNANAEMLPHGALAFGLLGADDRASRIAFGEKCGTRKPLDYLTALLTTLTFFTTIWVTLSFVKINSYRIDCPLSPNIVTSIPAPTFDFDFVDRTIEWQNRNIGSRSIPLLNSVPIVERDGVLYDLTKAEPRLFDDFPNAWLRTSGVNFLDRHMPRLDPDGDRFTNLEEHQAGTNPTDSVSHPELVHLLEFVSRKFTHYHIRYAASPDQNTVQLRRTPTPLHPQSENFYLREGDLSADNRIRLVGIGDNVITIKDERSANTYQIQKRQSLDIKRVYAELRMRGVERSFFVEETTDFYLPGEDAGKWRLLEVSDDSCVISRNEKQVIIKPQTK